MLGTVYHTSTNTCLGEMYKSRPSTGLVNLVDHINQDFLIKVNQHLLYDIERLLLVVNNSDKPTTGIQPHLQKFNYQTRYSNVQVLWLNGSSVALLFSDLSLFLLFLKSTNITKVWPVNDNDNEAGNLTNTNWQLNLLLTFVASVGFDVYEMNRFCDV